MSPDDLKRLMMATWVRQEGDRLANEEGQSELPDVCMDCGTTSGPFRVVTSFREEGDEFVVTMEGKRCAACFRKSDSLASLIADN